VKKKKKKAKAKKVKPPRVRFANRFDYYVGFDWIARIEL
jgi:hypothetical protein